MNTPNIATGGPLRMGDFKEPNPPGWWKIANRSGMRSGVIASIQSQPDVPDDAKMFLIGRIHAKDARFNHIRLDAHCHISPDGDELVTFHIKPTTILV